MSKNKKFKLKGEIIMNENNNQIEYITCQNCICFKCENPCENKKIACIECMDEYPAEVVICMKDKYK